MARTVHARPASADSSVAGHRRAALRSVGVQLAIGIMNKKRYFERRMIRHLWARMLPERMVAVRFVQQCHHAARTATVCVAEEEEHPKALAWFELALKLFPHAQWIGHCDDDVYLQVKQVHAELSQLTPWREAYGLVNIMKHWMQNYSINRF